MKKTIVAGGVLYLEFQLIIMIVRFLCGFSMIIVRMFIHNALTRDIIFGSSALFLEILAISRLFRNQKVDNRKALFQDALISLPIPLLVQFLLGMIFNFAYYTAGSGISVLGMAWWKSIDGGLLIYDQREAPLYPFIVFFLIKTILILVSTFVGFKLGERKIKKEQMEITKH